LKDQNFDELEKEQDWLSTIKWVDTKQKIVSDISNVVKKEKINNWAFRKLN
jgi:ABC-2 type transport system permease protein